MKIYDASVRGQHTFTGYGDDYVSINGTNYRSSLLVTAGSITENWFDGTVDLLTEAHFEGITVPAGGVILLGTGIKQTFPALGVLRSFAARGIPVEVMDNSAACRTFNILVAEGRDVAAAIILPSSTPPNLDKRP